MARIRTIKPDFFKSETIEAMSLSAQRTFVGLWCYCDDEGRGKDDTRLIKAEVWPLRDSHTPTKVDRDLEEIEAADLIARYEVDGKRYIQIVNWTEHQRVSHPKTSIFPSLPENFVKPPENVGKPQGRKGRERKGTGNSEKDEAFETFWKAYPTRRGVKAGKKQAAAEWVKLNPEQRERAGRAVVNYRRTCEATDTWPKDAERFLKHELFEDFMAPLPTAPRPEHPPVVESSPLPSCEHASPMCMACRAEGAKRARALASGIGEVA